GLQPVPARAARHPRARLRLRRDGRPAQGGRLTAPPGHAPTTVALYSDRMTAIDDILRHNAGVEPPEPALSSTAPPRKRLAIVACMDARIVPERHLGIRPGDVHLIRNAGGRLAEAVRSLALSQ